jgi:hypothetical protein
MSYTLTFSHPHFPDGIPFNIGNLGSVPNGGTLEVDEEMERFYIMTHGVTLEDGFNDDATVTLAGTSALDPAEVQSIIDSINPPQVTPAEVAPTEVAPTTAPTTMFSSEPASSEGGGDDA